MSVLPYEFCACFLLADLICERNKAILYSILLQEYEVTLDQQKSTDDANVDIVQDEEDNDDDDEC